MIKLLQANFFRLKKDFVFWLFIFITIGSTIFILVQNFFSNTEKVLDGFINELIMIIGILIAIFVSIFVGKEYSQGIIRNKLIVRAY